MRNKYKTPRKQPPRLGHRAVLLSKGASPASATATGKQRTDYARGLAIRVYQHARQQIAMEWTDMKHYRHTVFSKSAPLIFTIVAVFALAVSCSRQAEFPRDRYVIASDGLIVRTAPDVSSERIDTLPFAAKVSLLAKSDHEFEVTGPGGGKIRERWYRISFQGRDGWLFGGFLGDFDELNRRIEQARKSDARFVPEAYRHLVEGAPKRIDRILYYPGGDMRPAESIS
jgi:hypothetical protein